MKIRNMALCAMFAALLAVCAWVAFPVGDSVITMQTFALFLTLGILGGKRGTVAVCVYLLLGMVLGLLGCYLLGTLWFGFGYLSAGALSWGAILLKCVVPYLLPDTAKLIMAWLLARRLWIFV